MRESQEPDYYEILQVSPRADRDTVDRVFRHLAQRYHPDHETGDPDLFTLVLEAYRVLSDPEKRADYDSRYQALRETQWRIFDPQTAGDNVEEDRRIRQAILAALYTARRNDVDQPGMGTLELEQLIGCPQEHMKFHVWYLKENGWVERLPNGLFAVTASGVDKALEIGTPWQRGRPRLRPGESDGNGAASGEGAS